jgi:hypothetical protein
MNGVLRFDGGVHRDPAIERWFDTHVDPLGALARPWFERMRACGDDVRELMHDGCPTACVGDVGFGYVDVFTQHANVGFFRATELADPAGMLEGTGKLGRHVKLRAGFDVDADALAALIKAAYRNARAYA